MTPEETAVRLLKLAKKWDDSAEAEQGEWYGNEPAYRECVEDLKAFIQILLPEFECCWCRDHAELPRDEYTFPASEFGGWCEDTNRPICKECRWNAEEATWR